MTPKIGMIRSKQKTTLNLRNTDRNLLYFLIVNKNTRNHKSVCKLFVLDMNTWANKTAGEETTRQLYQNIASNLEQVLMATPHETPTIRPPVSYHENYPS